MPLTTCRPPHSSLPYPHTPQSFNQLTGAVPEGLAGHPSLHSLDLKGNPLTALPPGWLQRNAVGGVRAPLGYLRCGRGCCWASQALGWVGHACHGSKTQQCTPCPAPSHPLATPHRPARAPQGVQPAAGGALPCRAGRVPQPHLCAAGGQPAEVGRWDGVEAAAAGEQKPCWLRTGRLLPGHQ